MREYYTAQLETLNTNMIQMGALCEDAISAAIQSLLEDDRTIAKKVADTELEIDQMERDIERQCMRHRSSGGVLGAAYDCRSGAHWRSGV